MRSWLDQSPFLCTRRGILSDRDIRAAIRRGELVVTDIERAMLRPAAVSLRLGTEAYVLSSHQPVDIAQENTFPRLVARPVDEHGRIVLRPGEVLLARTSNYARLGISVVLSHQVSPGYGMPMGSPLTLEIVSRLRHDVYLRPGVRIANLMLLRGSRAQRSYRDMPANHSTPHWSVRSRLSEVVGEDDHPAR
jgi:dCTP deaminase